MAQIFNGRMTAEIEGDFVVFLIGMRINKPWKVGQWLSVARTMPKMLRELEQHKELGLLGYQFLPGFPVLFSVQYWRSFEQLTAYARSASSEHLPAWRAFNRLVGSSGDVGIWHETYHIQDGQYETIYGNMPAFGMGRVGRLLPVGGRRESARERMGNSVRL
ncbi:MAG TPA: DUF4188 domain-containing protein [Roseiflexaceae bacterium]|nr:DUF4188 domain-containing protein [Roseiflexaceae bacterium]